MTRTRARRIRTGRLALVAGAAFMAVLVPATTAQAALPSNSDLAVVRLDPDPATPGGSTTVHGFVANGGPQKTANSFTVSVRLPRGVTPEEPYFPEDCQATQGLLGVWTVRCVFPAGLNVDDSATALVPVRVSEDAPLGNLTGGRVSVSSIDDILHLGNNSTPFVMKIVETGRQG
ncbi:hypothetical protein [Kitasatospora purpeofusca]|uniref:hypothetical protein n=1 Tax=Kitasatospora purpeofusca TaxID=67352 RepID=UPI0038125C3D